MPRYQVQTGQLREAAAALARAAEVARSLVEHPGVVRGRAHDGGDELLAAAGAQFADRWQHGLRLMSAHSQRMADALRLAADTYDRVELAAWPRSNAGEGR